MSVNKENSLTQAYIELNKYNQNGDYARALKTATKILQIAPTEQKAFHCKIVCYIHLHDLKEALSSLTNPKNSALASGLVFEKAYVLYRLNNPKEALQAIDAVSDLTPNLKELRAQILYRLEQYQECYNLYREIVKNTTDDYEDERKANMAAVLANIAGENPSSELPEFDESTYELRYNRACNYAMRGKYSEALPILKKAEQQCTENILEDGGTEEEAKEEGAIIRVQQAYCQQMLGKEKEAASIYQSVLKDKPADQSLIAIASNNLVVINRDTNVFDSRKRMKAATQDGLEHKLTFKQRVAIAYNQAILAIYSNQPDFCKQCCVKLAREFNMTSKAALIEASSMAREGKTQQALALLSKCGDELNFAAVQILLSQSDRTSAIKLLQESKFKYKPGVIGLLVTLLCADNQMDKAIQLFNELFEYYKKTKQNISNVPWLRGAAALGKRVGGTAGTALCARALEAAAPTDTKSLARLVRALASHDPQRAKKLAQQLPPVHELEGKIDIDALESSKWMMGAKIVKKTTKDRGDQSPGTPSSDMTKKKPEKKRKRKTKLPPNADLSKPPDPERWLPKYERTAYRKRRAGNRMRDVIKGSQGMTTAATDQYDMTKQQASATITQTAKSPHVDKTSSGESAWKRKQQHKNKGKGRRW